MIPHAELVLFQHNVDTFWTHTLASFRDKGGTVACEAGCHHCCKVYATCSESEADLLAEYVCRDPDRERVVTAAVDAYLERLKASRHDAGCDGSEDEDTLIGLHFGFDLRCPFLDEDDRCRAYIVRPYGCRTHWAANSPDACAAAAMVQKIQPTEESTDAFVDWLHETGRAEQFAAYDDVGRAISQQEPVGLIAEQVQRALARHRSDHRDQATV
jgi:Fe-S-cluster containining protein